MLVLGMAFIFTGYSVSSYGVILLKGWDIPFRSWISPLNPWQWPAGGAVPLIPATRLFPTSTPSAAANVGGGSAGGIPSPGPGIVNQAGQIINQAGQIIGSQLGGG